MELLNNLLSEVGIFFKKHLFLQDVVYDVHFISAFFPKGEPISAHLLRCGGFAVDNHSFTRRRLVTEPSSTRE